MHFGTLLALLGLVGPMSSQNWLAANGVSSAPSLLEPTDSLSGRSLDDLAARLAEEG